MKLAFFIFIVGTVAFAKHGYDDKLKKSAAEANTIPPAKVAPPNPAPVGTPIPGFGAQLGPSDPGDPNRNLTSDSTSKCLIPNNACKAFCMDSPNEQACLSRCQSGSTSCQ